MYKTKITLICFFEIMGVIHLEYLPKRTSINQTYYAEVLKRLTVSVRREKSHEDLDH
jgi:hypothetical protein